MKRILFLVLVLTLTSCYSGSRPPKIGAIAPDFTVQDSAHSVTLSQFRGKVVVLNFWASWCAPCIQETPALVAMQERMRSKDVVILGVSIDEDEAAYNRFLKQYGINFVTVREPNQNTARVYGPTGWPETYILDRNGVVRRKFIGPVEWTSPEVLEFLGKV